jgi:hypothetical protein
MMVMVMDGQGGGIGAVIIKGLRSAVPIEVEILALGTNSAATARMMKAGANRGATGENAIVQTAQRADVIMGPLAVLMAHAMMGEVTPKMAEAVSSSPARKIVIPLNQEKVKMVGVAADPLPHLVDEAVKVVKEMTQHV